MLEVVAILCKYLRKNNSVKDFLTNNKTTILKSDCERFRYSNSELRYFYRDLRYFYSDLRYFYSDYESFLQIDNLYRSKIISNLVRRKINAMYFIIEILLKI